MISIKFTGKYRTEKKRVSLKKYNLTINYKNVNSCNVCNKIVTFDFLTFCTEADRLFSLKKGDK